ncbi:MAG: hypothetical protein LBH73_07365, partial [Spirochaetaceae bacterium]|nr:hypothetical protein [Spirochaetaceae bacterium]
MSIQKPTLLCCLVSLGLALGFGFLVYRGLPAAGLSYGVISVDPSYNDRELRSLLAEAGIETVISESSQRVFYDSFDGIQAVPLDQYREYIDGVDPRDDGYAEKLRSVFIGKEGRRLFIPPRSGFFSGTQAALKGKVARALSGIPHSLKIEGFSRPLVFPLLVFAASSFLMLFFFRAGRVFVPALPLLGPLAWFGAPGFALAALACLMLEVLSPPLEEWTAGSLRLLRRPSGIKRLAASGFLLLCWGGLFIMSGIPLPLICILVPVLFLAWLSLWRKKALAQRLGHTRFVPLSILPEQGLFRESFRILLPFALGAAVAFAFPLFFQGIKLYHRS